MTIAFACPSCGKTYAVAGSFAGRAGKCKACGRAMTVPATSVEDEDEYGVAPVGYGLTEPVAAAPTIESASVFSRAAIDPETPSRRRPRPAASKSKRRRDDDEEPFSLRHRKVLIAVPIVLAVALGLIALIVPRGVMIAGCALAGAGSLLVLAGYVVGAYAAFTEDSLYGFAYLVFPLYTAYYLLTRWDDLWPWFAAMTVGVGLIAVAGVILENNPAPAEARTGTLAVRTAVV